MHTRTMQKLKIIINCGPCEAYIGKCLDSVRSQSYTHWEAYVTIDPYGDKTFEEAHKARGRDQRIFITRNSRPRYSMTNLVCAVERSAAQPEDIIVVLDGDDWFAVDQALAIIVDTYARSHCWMTYGSWVSNAPACPGKWPAYPEGTTDFRGTTWLATAVRTWKKWLWERIDDADLRDEHGQYFRVTEDLAAMFPMLEMSGTRRARHIPEVLMLYNRENPHSCSTTKFDELLWNARYIRSKRPYQPIADTVRARGAAR
jgi:glycosyltransferase involved in cell wall biosynthesis